ncbi:MAG: response regulator [Sandaracinaceae bacterium]|nr:response regulator [Sandaracinaceae bacterium]
MSERAPDPDDQEIARLRREVAELRAENDDLDGQVSLLVKTEHRLTRAQFEADRQLSRVRALSSFALASSGDESALDIAGRAARLLVEWFSVDRVVLVHVDEEGQGWTSGDGVPRARAPSALVELCRGVDPVVATLAELPWAIAVVTAEDARPAAETAFAVLPLGDSRGVVGLALWCRPNPRASYFSEPPSPKHLPFLTLLGNHVRHGLATTRLTRELRESTHELAQNNERLEVSLATVKQAHERLAQAAKLEAIGRLAGGIAHDFNNLLTVILANASLVLEDLPGDSSLRDDVEPILDAAQRARNLTSQLLLYSRKQESRPEELRLDVVVEQFSRIASRLIGEHIRLRISHDPRVGTVRVDRTQIDQALMNLATNARDAMPNGGTLSVETRPASTEELRRAGRPSTERFVVLSVADTGVGIDPQARDKIFEPFFTTKDARGTGLGLAIVRTVVEEARGHVLVSAEPQGGTRFSLLFPEASQPPRVAHTQSTLASILVVEDEDSIRETVSRILGRRGYRVVEARTGHEALAVVRSGFPLDLLVTDVVMPERTGPMVAAELREARPGLRVLYMSGYTFDALKEGELRPDERFLRKPFTPEQLLGEVSAALALRPSEQPSQAPPSQAAAKP